MLLAAMVVAGCRGTKSIVEPTPQQEERHDYTVMTFNGTVDGMSVSGQVRMERDKQIWCSVNKFIEVGRALATTDSVWVRVPLMNRYQKGDYKDLSRLANMQLTFKDLQGILESDDVEQKIEELGRRFGVAMRVKILRKEKVEKLTFPFDKGNF